MEQLKRKQAKEKNNYHTKEEIKRKAKVEIRKLRKEEDVEIAKVVGGKVEIKLTS